MSISRRAFLETTALGSMAAGPLAGADTKIPTRVLGKTGARVSILAMGGGSRFLLYKDEEKAIEAVHKALDLGITYIDTAQQYGSGLSEQRMGKGLKGRRDAAFLMTKVCTHGKGKDVAMKMLEESLTRLQTDHLDLWLIHAIDKVSEIDSAFAPGGVAEALDLARKQGKVRYVGFSGHTDPNLHLAMLQHGYRFDAVQMPEKPT